MTEKALKEAEIWCELPSAPEGNTAHVGIARMAANGEVVYDFPSNKLG